MSARGGEVGVCVRIRPTQNDCGSGPETMTLRLRIVSDQRRLLGDRDSIVFSVDGGTIGRSADNDWVLPDPLRFVSAHHARVHFRDGQFVLEDLSTNGVFVNDDTRPLAKSAAQGHPLRHGDVIRMGDYQIKVALEKTQPQPTQSGAVTDSNQVPTSIHALQGLGRPTAQTDIGAQLNLDDLLLPDSLLMEGAHPVNAYGQSVAAAAPLPARAQPQLIAADDPQEEAAVARRMARLARAARRDPNHAGDAPALYDVHSGMQAFCRGAGIDAEKLPPDAQTRLLHLAGQLLREALVGFKELDRSRNDLRNRYRIELAIEPDDPRPSLSRSTVEELLVTLLAQHEERRVDAVAWLRGAVAEARAHETASSNAMRTAFVEFLDRLDPAELEARFERAARRGKGRPADKAQYWELFTTFYRNLIEMPTDHLPHTFVEAFAAAYKEHVKKPS